MGALSSKNDQPVVSHDLYPTILSLAGLSPLPEQHLDGQNLKALLGGANPSSERTLYWHYPHYHGSSWKPGAAIRNGKWKLLEFYESNHTELYNLEEDPGEQKNLAETHPDQTSRLLTALHQWQDTIGAQRPKKNPTYSGNINIDKYPVL